MHEHKGPQKGNADVWSQLIKRTMRPLSLDFPVKDISCFLDNPNQTFRRTVQLPWNLVCRNLVLCLKLFFFFFNRGKGAELFSLTKQNGYSLLINALFPGRK